jgi:hypothetical protein
MKVHFTVPIAALAVGWFCGYHTAAHDLGHLLAKIFGG